MRMFAALSCLAASAIAAPIALADASGTFDSKSTCDARGAAAAAAMLGQFKDAIESRHPDKVTRLFAADATFAAFHADGVRASYDQIRDAFVYFLVTNPEIDFTSMTPSSGCGIVAIEGRATWTRSTTKPGGDTGTPVRISMILAETAEGWRIQQYSDERLEAVAQDTGEQQASTARRRSPAVAGFVARSRGSASKSGSTVQPAAAPSDGYRAGRWVGDMPTFD